MPTSTKKKPSERPPLRSLRSLRSGISPTILHVLKHAGEEDPARGSASHLQAGKRIHRRICRDPPKNLPGEGTRNDATMQNETQPMQNEMRRHATKFAKFKPFLIFLFTIFSPSIWDGSANLEGCIGRRGFHLAECAENTKMAHIACRCNYLPSRNRCLLYVCRTCTNYNTIYVVICAGPANIQQTSIPRG